MEDVQLFELQEQGGTQEGYSILVHYPQIDPDNCQFFQWVEEENQLSNSSSVSRETMVVADLRLQIEALQKKMRNLTNIVLLGFSILIIMLVLGGIYFRKNL